MTKPRNVHAVAGRCYFRWKIGGVSHHRRLPDPSSADFAAAYQAAIDIRDAQLAFGKSLARHDALSSGIPSIRAHNRRCRDAGQAGRIIPSWLVTLAREGRKRASRKGLAFTLDRTALALLVERSGGRCEVTGIAFEHGAVATLYRPFAPSLDRIDAAGGYTFGNVRLVCVIVNAALNQWGETAFWTMIEAAAKVRSRNAEISEVERGANKAVA